jgi:hypothetical protein
MIPDRLVDFSTDRRIKRQVANTVAKPKRETMRNDRRLRFNNAVAALSVRTGALIRGVSASQAVMYPSVFIPMLLKLKAVVETTKEGPLNPMPTQIPVIVDRRTKVASAAEIKSDWVASTASSGSSAAAYIAEEHRGRMPQRTTSLNSFIYYPNV